MARAAGACDYGALHPAGPSESLFRLFAGVSPSVFGMPGYGEGYREDRSRETHFLNRGFVIVSPHKNSVGLMPYLPGVRFWNPCTGNYAAYYKLTRETARCNDLPETEAVRIAKGYFGDLSRVLFYSGIRCPRRRMRIMNIRKYTTWATPLGTGRRLFFSTGRCQEFLR